MHAIDPLIKESNNVVLDLVVGYEVVGASVLHQMADVSC